MNKLDKLNQLKKQCMNCKRCALSKTRINVVFSDGNPDCAKIILIGEAPGANEDKIGIPFVGRAGKLLNEFLAKTGISRQNDVYIINTVKCRPPENRVPTPVEKAACSEYLLKQIDIIDPQMIVFCGTTALNSFYKEKMPISKIRGQWLDILINNKTYKSMAIFHPSYLLRNYSMDEGKPRPLMLKDLQIIKEALV